MKRTGVREIDRLQEQAEASAERTGRTVEQEFSKLLRSNPAAYQAYLRANPAQTGER